MAPTLDTAHAAAPDSGNVATPVTGHLATPVAGGALADLRAHWSRPDPYDYTPADLHTQQLAAAGELLAACRGQIPVLDRRAGEAGVHTIHHLKDLVPLLLAHTSYKSYPSAFLARGHWAGMGRWLGTLSTRSVAEVPVDGIADVDGWVARLHEHGHHVMSSSGTTGKPSFLPTSRADHDVVRDGYLAGLRAVAGVVPDGGRDSFLAVPRGSTTVVQLAMAEMAMRMSGPDHAVRYLSDRPMLIADLSRMGEIRQAIAQGTATPDDIAEHERSVTHRTQEMVTHLERFVDDVLAARGRPLFIAATYGLLWGIVRTGRARGITDGGFHPGTVLLTGGGLKGLRAPADFREQVRDFFGPRVGLLDAYGMSELNGPFARCAADRYHVPPTTILLPLDKAGETLLPAGSATATGAADATGAGGEVTARCAALDLAVHDRWGGVISGDRVTVSTGTCGCGRRSPALRDVVRYTDLPEGDDKLSCAGGVDAYIRGEISD